MTDRAGVQAGVQQVELPKDSRLHEFMGDGDFCDCFEVSAQCTPREAAEVITAFPVWAQSLLMLRKVVTAPFGLSQEGPDVADKVGPFPVEHETGEELIAGFNDKHLDFRVSVIAREGKVSLATWVHTHNIGGKMYLACIMPFHILIARDALRRVAAR